MKQVRDIIRNRSTFYGSLKSEHKQYFISTFMGFLQIRIAMRMAVGRRLWSEKLIQVVEALFSFE